MACDTRLKPRQTIQQRAEEVRRAVAKLDKLLAAGTVKAKVTPQGTVSFIGFDGADRDGITDACAYRRLMVSGGALAKAKLAAAEALAGRSVDRKVIGQGLHSHDHGRTFHNHKH